MQPITNEGYKLFLDGTIALSQVEHDGMKIDTEYLHHAIRKIDKKIRKLSTELKEGKDCKKVYNIWQKRFGVNTNLGSHAQLGTILFNVLKLDGGTRTLAAQKLIETGGIEVEEHARWKTDKVALEDIDLPFVKTFLAVEQLKKARSTYLGGILREVDSYGYLHPSFHLHTVVTYRGSASDPNTQNIPIRDPDIAAIIRPAFVSRWKNGQIGEADFSGIEVRVNACYNQDPNLLNYIRDKTSDMHRDMAMQCYLLKLSQMTKDIRYCAKNKFVFPQFYGDWYFSCAQSLWTAIDRMHLTTADGVPLKEHLAKKGITRLGILNPKIEPVPGTFIHHLKKVERDFWGKRFKVYAKWKDTWWNEFLEKGYFDTYTGFRCSGLMDKKQVSNFPAQGSAFHCLLWCLIRIQNLLKKRRMKTVLIGQIHDSLLADIARGELQDYVEMAHTVMTQDLMKHWDWIIVPMECELEVAPPGESWHKKEKISLEVV